MGRPALFPTFFHLDGSDSNAPFSTFSLVITTAKSVKRTGNTGPSVAEVCVACRTAVGVVRMAFVWPFAVPWAVVCGALAGLFRIGRSGKAWLQRSAFAVVSRITRLTLFCVVPWSLVACTSSHTSYKLPAWGCWRQRSSGSMTNLRLGCPATTEKFTFEDDWATHDDGITTGRSAASFGGVLFLQKEQTAARCVT